MRACFSFVLFALALRPLARDNLEYPLTTLMLADIREIIIVTTPDSIDQFVALLGDGAQWGLKLSYRVQNQPDGIAAGLRIADADLRGHNIALILGDNIFYGAGLARLLETSKAGNPGATIFGYEVADPKSRSGPPGASRARVSKQRSDPMGRFSSRAVSQIEKGARRYAPGGG